MSSVVTAGSLPTLRARRIGFETPGRDFWALMRHDCAVCRSEGLVARAQVALRSATGEIIASLMHGGDDLLEPGEIGLCEAGWAALGTGPGDAIVVAHPHPLPSLAELRRRVYGNRLGAEGFSSIV